MGTGLALLWANPARPRGFLLQRSPVGETPEGAQEAARTRAVGERSTEAWRLRATCRKPGGAWPKGARGNRSEKELVGKEVRGERAGEVRARPRAHVAGRAVGVRRAGRPVPPSCSRTSPSVSAADAFALPFRKETCRSRVRL